MRIDLRYIITAAVFYAPGLVMLIGAWMLGFDTSEVRHDVLAIGWASGTAASLFVGMMLFLGGKPIWWVKK